METKVELFTLSQVPTAVAVLTAGMHTNPVNVAAMPDDGRRKVMSNTIFRAVTTGQLTKGKPFVAIQDGSIVGYCGNFAPGHCQLKGPEKLRTLPILLGAAGLSGTGRILSWFGEWAKHDPSEPHWHLGPIAVLPDSQGKGVGTAMMTAFCDMVDGDGIAAYLETDKDVNVGFYKKFGFEVVGEGLVIGAHNWYMKRPAKS